MVRFTEETAGTSDKLHNQAITQTPSESPGPSGHPDAAQLPPGQLAPDATNYLPGCQAHPTDSQLPPGQPASGAANYPIIMCNQVWKTSEATPET